ncbi:MAG: HD domain-containing protein [Planctomycetales bacterium]|nr:HD domain-containing protein [Planctomycetales bacterium]
MRDIEQTSLSHCPVHGYIPFVSQVAGESEVAERQIIDHPWVQRLRQIHQLQTAWWVYPTAEHTRFQHVLGAMHLASRATEALYDSLAEVCPETPSRGYVESLLRMAALLHDVGHGPFGHFFDKCFLQRHDQTHETVGAHIIEHELGDLIRAVRRNPFGELAPGETLDPAQICALITRPRDDGAALPRWLRMLRSLFSGIYTVDNMDFVLRDAFMSGYSARAFDLDRLLRYSFFTDQGLTIHRRGLEALVRFMGVRGELFRAVYFHRTVRGIDMTLEDLFRAGSDLLFPGNPLEHLDTYQHFTEFSLLVDVARWPLSDDERRREVGEAWRRLLRRDIPWRSVCERNLVFTSAGAEPASIFSDEETLLSRLRKSLPSELAEAALRVDLPRHIHRPGTSGAATGQNFLYTSERDEVRPLTDDQLFRHLPLAGRICRIYAAPHLDAASRAAIAAALDDLLGGAQADDLTNM